MYEPSLYSRLGGKETIAELVSDFTLRILNDHRIRARFDGANLTRFKITLAEQICAAAAGPCLYTGLDMASAHAGMRISEAEFGIFMEDLTWSLDQTELPAREKSEVIGILLPMKYELVGR